VEYIVFLVSMAALIKGADYVIDESEKIALHFNISHFVIGATIVALGTSLPEMAASIFASANGKSDLAVSNVIGSTIFNISLVLGVVFIMAGKLIPTRDMFAEDSAWALFPIFIFLVVGFDGEISRWEGLIYLAMMGAYVMFLTKNADDLVGEINGGVDGDGFDWQSTGLWLLLGFVLVVVGVIVFVVAVITVIVVIIGIIIVITIVVIAFSLVSLLSLFLPLFMGRGSGWFYAIAL
jgi:cation:H+ antiporter